MLLTLLLACIFNCSLSSGILPVQWLSAVITPVPKIVNPVTLADFRPILLLLSYHVLLKNLLLLAGYDQPLIYNL